MKKRFLVIVFLMALMLSGCGGVGSGKVVKVSAVTDGSYAGLDAEAIDKISKIRKTVGQRTAPAVAITGATRNYTAEEYLKLHPEMASQGGSAVYKVGANDVLNIEVFDEENLSRGGVRVAGDGYISFPLIGRVYVDGLAGSEIEYLLAKKLADGQFILKAQVSVLVSEFSSKKYKVLGAVEKPGIYSLKIEQSLLDAISSARGVDLEASGKRLMLIRLADPEDPSGNGEKVVINVDLDKLLKGADQISNLLLQDKDMVYIPKAEFFYIMGQVQEPGSYKFSDADMTIVEAIGTAGGFTPIAARKRTRIIRVEEGEEKIITVNVDAIINAGKKIQDVSIRPGDIIIVPESFF